MVRISELLSKVKTAGHACHKQMHKVEARFTKRLN